MMDMEGWRAYVLSKWARIEGTLPGLSFSQTGPDEATFILGFSSPEFGEQRVIIGRPATVRARPYLGTEGRAKESGFVDDTIIDGGENVSMKEIEAIIACWKANKRYVQPKATRR